MRALAKWSDNSLSITTPRPCQGDPSRRIARLLFTSVLEVTGVDRFKARLFERQLFETTAGCNHRGRGFWAQIAITDDAEAVRSWRFHAPDACEHRKTPEERVAAFGL